MQSLSEQQPEKTDVGPQCFGFIRIVSRPGRRRLLRVTQLLRHAGKLLRGIDFGTATSFIKNNL
jgi:hypothetical protein